jgi:hypothetical protein
MLKAKITTNGKQPQVQNKLIVIKLKAEKRTFYILILYSHIIFPLCKDGSIFLLPIYSG